MGWKFGWCYSYGSVDREGRAKASVPAGHQLHWARTAINDAVISCEKTKRCQGDLDANVAVQLPAQKQRSGAEARQASGNRYGIVEAMRTRDRSALAYPCSYVECKS